MSKIIHQINTEPQTFTIDDWWDEAENIRTYVFRGTLNSKPGQFCMLWIPEVNEKPFSIARDYDGEIWLTICRVGKFTEKLFELKKGDKIGLRGSFGHGFSVKKIEKNENEKPHIVLVGGGYGTAPLHFCGKEHLKNGAKVSIIIGARNKDLIIHQKWCKQSGFETLIATNDGSAGKKGFTTDVLQELIAKEKVDLIQTCGPEKMMEAIAKISQEKNIKCEVSIERYVKCGFGVCGQCVVSNGQKMCQQGPVVDAEIALKLKDFGSYHRGAEGQIIPW